MIKKGDNVICVCPTKSSITIGKIYTVIEVLWQKNEKEKSFSNVYIAFINDFGWKDIFKFKGNFITIDESREQQIN